MTTADDATRPRAGARPPGAWVFALAALAAVSLPLFFLVQPPTIELPDRSSGSASTSPSWPYANFVLTLLTLGGSARMSMTHRQDRPVWGVLATCAVVVVVGHGLYLVWGILDRRPEGDALAFIVLVLGNLTMLLVAVGGIIVSRESAPSGDTG